MKGDMNPFFKIIDKYPKTFLVILSALVFFPLLGSYPLLGQWETHYGRVAMEMVANKNGIFGWFLDPIYLGNYDFWSKPIFCFWMVIPFYMILGPTEWATRLPFAINGIIGIVLVYYIFNRFYNNKARAIVTSVILIFTPYYYLITKQFMWDITMVVFFFVCVMFIYIGMRDNDKKLLRWAYAAAGIVMLTKGLLAIVLPAGIFFIWMLVSTDYSKVEGKGCVKSIFLQYWDFIKRSRLFEGLLIFLAVSAWWYIYMYAKHGTPFLKEFFIENHFGRMEGLIDKPDGPFEYYVWQMALGAFPWAVFFIPALYFMGLNKSQRKEESFIAVCFFFIFLFFTLSATKFPHYIFPAMPFFAAIVALPFLEFYNGRRTTLYPLTAVFAAATLGVIAKDMGTGMNYREILYIITTHRIQDWFGRVYDMLPYLRIFVPPMVFFILLPLIFIKSRKVMKISLAGFFIFAIGFAGYMNFYFVPKVLWVFSPKQLAEKFKEIKQPGDIIVDYDNWKNRCMYFYLGLENNFERLGTAQAVKEMIEQHPDNAVFITTKTNKVPELRSAIMNQLGIPLVKIMDDRTDTYMEIEMLRASMKDKGQASDESWKKNLLTEETLPKNLNKVNGTFDGGKIEVIGYEINKTVFDPKEEIRLTMYYRVLKEIPKSYRIFFHFDVYNGALPYSFKHDEYPLDGFYPTNKWKPGDIIRNEFTDTVPGDHPGGGIKIYTGFFEGNDRLKIDNEKFNDGQDRFILGTFDVRIN